MASYKALCLAGVASLVATASGHAADLLPPPPPPPVYAAPAPVVLGGNWYLRGDVGIGIADLRTQSTFNYYVPDQMYDQKSLDDTGFLGAGVGYRFNRFFRVDVTGDYHASSQYSEVESYNQGYYHQPKPITSISYDGYRGSQRIVDGLLNGYIDLGTWNCITPFVGGGVGVANINVGSIIDNGSSGGFGYSQSKSTTNFAFAAMAGLDFQVSRNLVLEAGYRYLNVGSYSSGTINCSQTPCTGEVQHYKLAENEIRLGLRYILPDYMPIGPAPVLVSKY